MISPTPPTKTINSVMKPTSQILPRQLHGQSQNHSVQSLLLALDSCFAWDNCQQSGPSGLSVLLSLTCCPCDMGKWEIWEAALACDQRPWVNCSYLFLQEVGEEKQPVLFIQEKSVVLSPLWNIRDRLSLCHLIMRAWLLS